MSKETRFVFDRNGYTGPLTVDIISEGLYGAAGAQGAGQAVGYPKGIINASGNLQLSPGVPYTMPVAVIGVDNEPPQHRLIVRRGLQILATIPFKPVVAAGQSFLDINHEAVWEDGPLASPGERQQFLDLVNTVNQALSDLQAANNLLTPEGVEDLIGQMFDGNVGVTYNDTTGKLIINLSNPLNFPRVAQESDIPEGGVALHAGVLKQRVNNVVTIVAGNLDEDRVVELILEHAPAGGTALSRTSQSVTTSVLPNGASEDLSIQLSHTYLLHHLLSSHDAWVRVYLHPDDRIADGSRPQTTDPSPNAGVVAELIGRNARWAQAVVGWDDKDIPDGLIPLRVTNLSGSTRSLTITAHVLALEV